MLRQCLLTSRFTVQNVTRSEVVQRRKWQSPTVILDIMNSDRLLPSSRARGRCGLLRQNQLFATPGTPLKTPLLTLANVIVHEACGQSPGPSGNFSHTLFVDMQCLGREWVIIIFFGVPTNRVPS